MLRRTVLILLLFMVAGCDSDPLNIGYPDVAGIWEVTEDPSVQGGMDVRAPLLAGDTFSVSQEGSTVVLTFHDGEPWTTLTIQRDGSFASEEEAEGTLQNPETGDLFEIKRVVVEEGAFSGSRMEYRLSVEMEIAQYNRHGQLIEIVHEDGASITRAERVNR